jgi:hypothetical protein
LNPDEETMVDMLNLFQNRTSKFKYAAFYNNEGRLKTPLLSLIKKGIVFLGAEEALILSPAYWADVEHDAETWNLLTNIVTELHAVLRNKRWNYDLFREELIAVAPNIKRLHILLRDRLLALGNKHDSLSDDEITRMLDIEDFLLRAENVLLFAGIAAARKNNDGDIFADTLELCNLLLKRHPGMDKELRRVWVTLKKECESYVLFGAGKR